MILYCAESNPAVNQPSALECAPFSLMLMRADHSKSIEQSTAHPGLQLGPSYDTVLGSAVVPPGRKVSFVRELRHAVVLESFVGVSYVLGVAVSVEWFFAGRCCWNPCWPILDMDSKPEAGGSWFVLCVDSPTSRRVILTSEAAVRAALAFDGDLLDSMKADGYIPVVDGCRDWIALSMRTDVSPSCVPPSIQHLARFVAAGTVVSLDNGCWPSLEWRFEDESVVVWDTFDDGPI